MRYVINCFFFKHHFPPSLLDYARFQAHHKEKALKRALNLIRLMSQPLLTQLVSSSIGFLPPFLGFHELMR